MANPRHTTHLVVTLAAFIVGGVLAIAVGDPTVPLIFSGAGLSAIGYALGAAAHRRHG